MEMARYPIGKNISVVTQNIKFSQVDAGSGAVKIDASTDMDMGDDKNDNKSFSAGVDQTATWDIGYITAGSDPYLVRKKTVKDDGLPHVSAGDVGKSVDVIVTLSNSVSQRVSNTSIQRTYKLNVQTDSNVSYYWAKPKMILGVGRSAYTSVNYYPGGANKPTTNFLKDYIGSKVNNMVVDGDSNLVMFRSTDCAFKSKMDTLTADNNGGCAAQANGDNDYKTFLQIGSNLRFVDSTNPVYSIKLYLNYMNSTARNSQTGPNTEVNMFDGSNAICLTDKKILVKGKA